MNRMRRRKIENVLFQTAAALATLVGLFWLVFVVGDVLLYGLSAINLDLILNDPVPAGMEGGGLRHAFVGQLMITGCAALVGIPIGVLAGTFLAEYAKDSKWAVPISFLSNILVSIPTIVIGTFVYAVVVQPLGHFSGWSGSIALCIIMVPVIVNTTSEMLSLVSSRLREAAFALGAPRHKVIIQVVYPSALSGIATGVLLSIARIAGETAPLLFTAFNSAFFSTDMSQPMATLNTTIYQYATGPYDSWHKQAWAASLFICLFILTISVIARWVIYERVKKRM